ncbi:MAG: peptidylprolyl isomerase [Gemmatimonadota bacterium]|nr:peptidylprolyl isomerase [Gemmatimonadota bacterium]MDH4347384.1 peptidylprolyl isomerase [Gemmatimonadota bacterium]MDH5282913.1 peptidylprolyl isomerase [Gemmatimonadota bacterium]
MRRWSFAAVVLAVLGGTGCKEMFQARPDVVAEASGQTLRAERVAELMNSIKGFPISREAADFLANMWVDHTIFAQALAAGRDMTDSATAERVLWPELAELKAGRFHDSLVAARVPITDQVADSIYDTDAVRLLQHILIRVEPNAEPPVKAEARTKADRALSRVRSGGDFARLAGELSDDPGSRRDGGYLPPAPRGQYVTAFDSAGWTLAPGALSGLVETPHGYHIIRRPPAAEVRDRLLAFARERLGVRLDSMYLDSLAGRYQLRVDGGAAQSLRAAITDRTAAVRSKKVLARYDGGDLTVSDFMRWAAALPPSWGTQMLQQPDSSLTAFVEIIGKNELLLQEAERAGIQPTPVEWASMYQTFRAQLDTLRMNLGLSASEISDPGASPGDRARVAAMKIEGFWDKLAVGGTRPRPVPPQLAYVLRQEAEFSVEQAGIARAIELAAALKAQQGEGPPAGPPPAGPPDSAAAAQPPEAQGR